jgi:hypothetical protein
MTSSNENSNTEQQKAESKVALSFLKEKAIQPYVWVIGDRKSIVDIQGDYVVLADGSTAPQVPYRGDGLSAWEKVRVKTKKASYTYRELSLYQKEFGYHFDLGFDIELYPFLKDTSWHNDLVPTFVWRSNDRDYRLSVCQEKPSDREHHDMPRYSVDVIDVRYQHLDEEDFADSEVIFSHESVEELFRFLRLF